MKEPFDVVAENYDKDFTFSQIGRSQREQVWSYLNKVLPQDTSWNVLELNCGTGEDALRLAKRGHEVLATDISESMIQVAKTKIQPNQNINLKFERSDIRNIVNSDKKYDLIFSNFGGLNCLSPEELDGFLSKTSNMIEANGHMILVLMPRFCFAESVYFLSKFKFKSAFRRMTKKPVIASLDQGEIPIWYYNPRRISNKIKSKLEGQIGIGFFVPPSYLEGKMGKSIIDFFHKMDLFFQRFRFPSLLSDHYLIDISFRS